MGYTPLALQEIFPIFRTLFVQIGWLPSSFRLLPPTLRQRCGAQIQWPELDTHIPIVSSIKKCTAVPSFESGNKPNSANARKSANAVKILSMSFLSLLVLFRHFNTPNWWCRTLTHLSQPQVGAQLFPTLWKYVFSLFIRDRWRDNYLLTEPPICGRRNLFGIR